MIERAWISIVGAQCVYRTFIRLSLEWALVFIRIHAKTRVGRRDRESFVLKGNGPCRKRGNKYVCKRNVMFRRVL